MVRVGSLLYIHSPQNLSQIKIDGSYQVSTYLMTSPLLQCFLHFAPSSPPLSSIFSYYLLLQYLHLHPNVSSSPSLQYLLHLPISPPLRSKVLLSTLMFPLPSTPIFPPSSSLLLLLFAQIFPPLCSNVLLSTPMYVSSSSCPPPYSNISSLLPLHSNVSSFLLKSFLPSAPMLSPPLCFQGRGISRMIERTWVEIYLMEKQVDNEKAPLNLRWGRGEGACLP